MNHSGAETARGHLRTVPHQGNDDNKSNVFAEVRGLDFHSFGLDAVLAAWVANGKC